MVKIKIENVPTCSNGRIGLKVGKFGGFVGCSNYPDCKYTIQFSQITDAKNGTLTGAKRNWYIILKQGK